MDAIDMVNTSFEPESTPDGGPTPHEIRKGCKKRARAVFKKHYALFVIICLLAALIGTEFSFVKSQTDNLYNIVTGQEIGIEHRYVQMQDKQTQIAGDFEKLADLVFARENEQAKNDDEQAAVQESVPATEATEQEQAVEQQSATEQTGDEATPKYTRGILSSVVNLFTSGRLIDIFYNAIASIVKSPKLGAIIFVLLGFLLVLAVWVFIKNMIQAIVRRVFLEGRQYKKIPISHMFQFRLFKQWINASMSLFLTTVYYTLWSLTVVGGVIK